MPSGAGTGRWRNGSGSCGRRSSPAWWSRPWQIGMNKSRERELRPVATYRKVTGGFRSKWGADLYAAVRSVIGTAAHKGIDAFQAIRAVLQGNSVFAPG